MMKVMKIAGLESAAPARECGAAGDADGGPSPPLCAFAIHDLQAFTDALRAHRPGDEVVLTFLRDGSEATARTTPGDRADRPR